MATCPKCGRSGIHNKKSKENIEKYGMCGMCLRGFPKSFDTSVFGKGDKGILGDFVINE